MISLSFTNDDNPNTKDGRSYYRESLVLYSRITEFDKLLKEMNASYAEKNSF